MKELDSAIDFYAPSASPLDGGSPLAQEGLSCGFPSPAAGYLEEGLDLNRLVVRDRATTFFGRVRGDSMRDADILDGDLLVIDRGLKPQNDDIALCLLDGEFTVKRLHFVGDGVSLLPENGDFEPIRVGPDNDFEIWGVVTYSFRKSRKRKDARR